MGARWLTDMADILRAAGLPVVEQDGWQNRSRSSGGFDGDRPWCVMWHHTASSANATAEGDATYMSYNADAAPIANILLARDGTVWVLAAGATNTNGSGTGGIDTSHGRVPDDAMNTHAVGLEIQNTGVGQTYSQACIDNAFTLSLALCAAYGLAPTDAGTHHAYASDRKIDPATAEAVQGPWRPASTNSSGSWSLDDLRAELAARAAGPTPLPPLDLEEDDMPFLIRDNVSGGVALVYGSGKVTGIDGTALPQMVEAFGDWIDVEPPTYQDFINKSS